MSSFLSFIIKLLLGRRTSKVMVLLKPTTIQSAKYNNVISRVTSPVQLLVLTS